MNNMFRNKNQKSRMVINVLKKGWRSLSKTNNYKLYNGVFVFIYLTITSTVYSSSMGEARAQFMYGMIPVDESYPAQIKTYIIMQNEEIHKSRIENAEKLMDFCSYLTDCLSSFYCCVSH